MCTWTRQREDSSDEDDGDEKDAKGARGSGGGGGGGGMGLAPSVSTMMMQVLWKCGTLGVGTCILSSAFAFCPSPARVFVRAYASGDEAQERRRREEEAQERRRAGMFLPGLHPMTSHLHA